MFKDFFDKLKEYARNTSYIESIIIVGSYAKGTNRENSDLDIVIVTSNKTGMISSQDFIHNFGDVYKQQTEYYGACTSIRVWYKDGKRGRVWTCRAIMDFNASRCWGLSSII